MPRIVRAEFLSYYNSRRNSDKLFNVFLIEDDNRTFRCVSEYGRRGTNLVCDTLCTNAARDFAESKLRQKLNAKRNHRDSPYTNEALGYNYSQIAREYGYDNNRAQENNLASNRAVQPPTLSSPTEPKLSNIIAFPAERKEIERTKPKRVGILNNEQFDSLEI